MVKQTPAQDSTPLKENHLSGSAGGPKFPRLWILVLIAPADITQQIPTPST